ncbi:AAA family ATPase [Anaeromicropila populeti]|uniref:AAA domain-containing protein, putative AbiEii toxin, Type IV TA system n=1 Tax=Anaeromicropila populeti TaxID=37658 RepID=A0A1I6JYV6_9FIRM|nr:AAA family ATPase [Anaeromicropila populeti]SFR84143.1 AAA domain-containing protein, putative AbiEii toxin, Type IV TA system [Anaeromicropila populeti]
MESNFVRLQKISINNIKNVTNGTIVLSKYSKNNEYKGENSILGIYGQNGSGKTAVVDVMYMLKNILVGDTLPPNTYKYIKSSKNEARLGFWFYVERGSDKYNIEYSFAIKKEDNKRIVLTEEKLYGAVCKSGIWKSNKKILSYDEDDRELVFRQKEITDLLKSDLDNFVRVKMAQELANIYDDKTGISHNKSIIFSKIVGEVFSKIIELKEVYEIINSLVDYATKDLIVIQNEDLGLIDLNLSKMVFHLNMKKESSQLVGQLSIDIEKKAILSKELFIVFEKVVNQTNAVISALIPDLVLQVSNVENKLLDNGEPGVSFELATKRNGSLIPLECESAGIKKLISVCNAIIACYNRASVCLIIDELDSGIFEYLLGQLIEIMQESAQGQMIFTSHNLRPLEVLDNESLIFTTTDSENCYGGLKYIKNTQNKRLSYLREIYLGTEEHFYKSTSQAKIKRAFRKSGRNED